MNQIPSLLAIHCVDREDRDVMWMQQGWEHHGGGRWSLVRMGKKWKKTITELMKKCQRYWTSHSNMLF